MIQCHNDDGLSGRGLMASLEGKDRSFSKVMANWVTTHFAVIIWNDVSFHSALATARIPALWVTGTLATQLQR